MILNEFYLKHYYKSFFNFMNVRGSLAHHHVLADKHADDNLGLPSKFSIGVWNTFKGGGGSHFDRDFLKIYRDHDILCLQEVLMSESGFWKLDNRLKNFVFASSYQRRDDLYEGVMSVATTSALDSSFQVPSRRTEPFLKTPKTSLVTEYLFRNGIDKLLVVNSHAILFRTVPSFDVEMSYLLAKISEYSGPAIICGDFNTVTNKYLRVLIDRFSNEGFQLAVMENESRKRHKVLDHIFYRGLNMVEAKIDKKIKSSDHPFLTATFEL